MGMLVLSRKKNETIVVADVVKITFLGMNGDKARFGIDAPADIPVDREEIYERKKKEGASDAHNESAILEQFRQEGECVNVIGFGRPRQED